ncbi:hypothetical protein BGX31_010733 [Mortierella sp. GBA43]|nr:hypothetical protein BGX31_010733 [Mortierella sp. GBA43]
MSLANYIRHIVSLSSGNTSSTLAQRQQEQQRQLKLQGCRPMSSYPSEAGYNADAVNGYGNSPRRVYQDSTSLPSPLSAGSGPGPIKAMMSLSSRKHRHSSEYHDHQTRRQMYHHSQQQQQHQLHRLPSPTSPTVNPQQQQRSQGMGAASSPTSNSPTRSVSPYLRIPYPNLTMTLALIYVDRLKAKYPEAKGEPGCSHRLFLVAYIIAAKYRCCVELAALLQEHEDHVIELENRRSRNDHGYNKHEHRGQGGESYYHSSYHSKHDLLDSTHKELVDRVFEARARAELILSNHEWVRLLCLGSFTRPSPSRFSTSAHAPGTMAARTAPSQPMTQPGSPSSSLVSPKPEPLPIHSPLPCDTVRGNSAHNVYHSALAAPGQVKPTLSSPALPSSPPPSTPQTPTAVFQVEDLDRMETEFLTFLDFDLSTRGQDLNTCWGLLVGSKS